MVSWSASAKVLSELVDESSMLRAEIIRRAARWHALRETNGLEGDPSLSGDADMVYICPPAWGLTPREFAATCFYASQEGWTWREWTGTSLMGSASLMALDIMPGYFGAMAFVGGAVLPITTWLQRDTARTRLGRLRDSDFAQVIEISMDDVAFDSMLRDDLAAADRMKPGGDDNQRRGTLTGLYLSAGGDQTVAATLPDRGWVTRPKGRVHWADRAVAAMGAQSCDGEALDVCACDYCESDDHTYGEHQPAAVTIPQPAAVAAPPAPKPTTMIGRWRDALARFEVVESEWEAIVTDPMAALDHAALLDMTLLPDGRPTRTVAFIEAFGKAKDLQARHAAHSPATGPEDRADVVEFEDAVRSAQITWTEAKKWAKHVGLNALPESERDIARTARTALALAMDDRTPIGEAAAAAEKAARLLRSIHTVVLPEPAMSQIETKARKAIG